jgi:hypothetical protein
MLHSYGFAVPDEPEALAENSSSALMTVWPDAAERWPGKKFTKAERGDTEAAEERWPADTDGQKLSSI